MAIIDDNKIEKKITEQINIFCASIVHLKNQKNYKKTSINFDNRDTVIEEILMD